MQKSCECWNLAKGWHEEMCCNPLSDTKIAPSDALLIIRASVDCGVIIRAGVDQGVVIRAGVDQGAIVGAGVDWDAVIGAGAC